jgi:hypothetical protein
MNHGSVDIEYLNELVEDTITYAEESGSTSTYSDFETFMKEMLPVDMLDMLCNNINANLEDIWNERFLIEEEKIEDNGDNSNAFDDYNNDSFMINCCEMCEREIALTRHHLIPREMHERMLKREGIERNILNRTISICRMCHSTIHRFFTNKELAESYNTLDVLLSCPKVEKYAMWASKLKSGGNKRIH